ncbi:hypothetical protein DC58_04320 [Vibrio navarrensis]|nr:hypothetical protein DC58_04320 [Vibrio navarrensis]
MSRTNKAAALGVNTAVNELFGARIVFKHDFVTSRLLQCVDPFFIDGLQFLPPFGGLKKHIHGIAEQWL